MQYNTAKRFLAYYSDPTKLNELKVSNRSNILKSLVALSRFRGEYEIFTKRIKAIGIKWSSKNGLESFMQIMNNGSHKDVMAWYKTVQTFLPDNERLYLKLILVSGMRAKEGLRCFNRIIELAKQNRLSEYYDTDQQILNHYLFKDNLRVTKNLYISFIDRELIDQIKTSKAVSYFILRKHLQKHKLNLQIKPLRSYNATFLRSHNVLAEIVDLLQSRINSRSVFLNHYLKLDKTEMSKQILNLQRELILSVE